MKLNQPRSLVSAAAYGCISSIILAAIVAFVAAQANAGDVNDKYRTHSGTECEQSFSSGTNLEFGVEGSPNTATGSIDGKVMITLNVELGRGSFNNRRIDCRQTMLYEQDRMYLENERLKLELELLRRKVEGDPNAGQTAAAATVTDGDDW